MKYNVSIELTDEGVYEAETMEEAIDSAIARTLRRMLSGAYIEIHDAEIEYFSDPNRRSFTWKPEIWD